MASATASAPRLSGPADFCPGAGCPRSGPDAPAEATIAFQGQTWVGAGEGNFAAGEG